MKKILVALDNSNASKSVLNAAVMLARAEHAELVLIRAYSVPIDVPMDIYYRPKDDIAEVLRKDAKAELDLQAAKVPGDVPTRTLVEMGVPWQIICEAAKREDVIVIVMGAHGYRFYERMLGTTSGRVVTHADRSVYVVRPR